MKLQTLNADELVNPDGVTIPLQKDSDERLINAIVAGSKNYQPWIRVDSLSPGQVGRIRYQSQPVSKEHAIFEVDQVINETEFIGSCGGKTFWITGKSTNGMSDGTELILSDVVEVVGSKTYETAIGSNTVLQLRISANSVDFNKLRTELIANPPKSNANIYRIWKTKDGKSIVGMLESYEKGEIIIKSVAGSTVLDVKNLESESKKIAMKIRKALKTKK